MGLPSSSENPDGLRTAILTIVGTTFAAFFLGLRVVNRLFILNAFAIDDWINLLALVIVLVGHVRLLFLTMNF